MKVRNQLIIVISAIIIITLVTITAVAIYTIKKQGQDDIETYRAEEVRKVKRSLKDMVSMSYNSMEKSDKMARDNLFLQKRYGLRLKDAISIINPILKEKARMVKEGKQTLEQAKKEAFATIRKIRYDNGTGYFWINDRTQPYPRMIMHPTMPELEGKVMDDPKFNCALGKNKSLFQAFVEVCNAHGGGFVDYLWPKPTQKGLTTLTPKLSYVKLFKEWNIIVGTGIYVDDAVADTMEKFKEDLSKMRYDNGTGYFWINDKTNPYPTMIMHPTSPDLDGKVMDDPKYNCALGKQKNLFKAIVEVCDKDGEGFIEYMWPKPTKDGLSKPVQKLSYVKLYKPWNWIVGTGVYIDNIEQEVARKTALINDEVSKVIRRILLISAIVFVAGILTSIIVARSLTVPIHRLGDSIRRIKQEGIYSGESPVAGTVETKELGEIFNSMIADLRTSDATNKALMHTLEEHNQTLEHKVAERTSELAVAKDAAEQSLANLQVAQKQLVESEKLAALGGLVAGIAHEINTPVGVGITAATHLQEKLNELSAAYQAGAITKADLEGFLGTSGETIGITISNLNRAAELIASFKQVAVDQASEELRNFNFKHYLNEVLLSLKHEYKRTKHVIEVTGTDDANVDSYPGAISQIATNLLMNSLIHAFDKEDEGKISFDVQRSNGSVTLLYSDNGKGIPQENLPRIFEPFFTTKRGKGGSGLGMHIVYNLVTNKLGGTINCASEVGKGTTFTITFPAGTKG